MKLKWKRHADLVVHHGGEVMDREEYLSWMTFNGGRVPFTEFFGPLPGVKEAWEEQGATPEELSFSAFRYRVPKKFWIPVNCGRMGAFQTEIEDRGDVIRYQDDLGRTLELKVGIASLPLPLNYPVKTMDDWLKIKPRYEFCPERFGAGWEEKTRRALEEGRVITAGIPGGFAEPRQLLGDENLCYACYEQPELLHDILDTIGETAYRVLDHVSSKVQIDELFVHEDMAGKSGPLFGPAQVLEFMKPYYRKIWDLLESRSTKIFSQDSDGNMNPVIDTFLECGINCMYPMEPGAGMDIVKVREKYGKRLMVLCGINKYVLARTKAEIEAELEYKLPAMIRSGGGFMPGLDHRIPTEVPLENYRFYIRKVWEIIERETLPTFGKIST